jgi:hypothetical protein
MYAFYSHAALAAGNPTHSLEFQQRAKIFALQVCQFQSALENDRDLL